MSLIPGKYFIFVLAAILVVAMGIMAVSTDSLRKKGRLHVTPENTMYQEDINKINSQSESTNLNSIENDLNNTDFSDIDNDLESLNMEFDQ